MYLRYSRSNERCNWSAASRACAVVDRTRVLTDRKGGAQLAADVQAALRADPVVETSEIDVAVAEGRVTLTGKVDSFAQRQLAAAAVAGVSGVVAIDDRITTVPKADRPNDEIRAEISRRFELNPFLAEGLIRIDVSDGAVRLSGVVGSVNERDIAGSLAWVVGVRDVDTRDVEVKWWLQHERRRDKFLVLRNDVELQRAVQDALLYDPYVRRNEIEVRVRLGAVSLIGNVSSLTAKHAAERDAKNTLGVRRVINNLKVKATGRPNDLEITKRANEALARDVHLQDYELRTSSHFGTVYLTGDVNSQFDKQRAETIVANVLDVAEVVNRLTVDAPWSPKEDDEIREDIDRRLRFSPVLDAKQIRLSVDDGVVTLSGTVDTWHERAAAGRHAYQGGARRVANELEVRFAPSNASWFKGDPHT